MNAYVDISYLFHLLVIFTLPYYYKRIMNTKIEIVSLSIFSILLYFNVFLFESYSYLNLAFILIYYLLLYRKNFFKYYLLFLFVYYSNVAITMIFTTDIYLYKCMVFLNSPGAFFYIFLELLHIFIIEIIMFSIKSIKLLKNYRMKIQIKFDEKFKCFTGYIDSGNTLLVDGVPVIFLKDNYFEDKKYKEMIVQGIGKRKCKYFKTKIIIQQMEKEVICASGSSSGFKGCDCLINIHLLEESNDETIK